MRWLALALLLVPSIARAQAPIALRGGWTLYPRTGISGVEAVACGADRAYARNWSGALAAWDGSAWSTIYDRTTSRYGRTIAVAPNGHAFLESGSAVAEWTGAEWIEHTLQDWAGELDTQLVAPHSDEVYVVGRGRIARFDGSRFTTYEAGTWRSLSAVAIVDGLPWVGGQGGTILRHDGARWVREETGIDTWVLRLVAFGATDVWALARGARWDASIVLHFDGQRWARRDPDLGSAANAIGGTADRVYLTGDFGLARWDGRAWIVELAPADLGEGYHALQGVCATDRHWVVGDRSGGALVRPRP